MQNLIENILREHYFNPSVPASPLMQTIIAAVGPAVDKGTVPPFCILGKLDHTQIEIIEGSENVFRLIVREIKKAKKQILIQAFVWDPTIQAVKDIKEALCGIDPSLEIDVFLLIDQLEPLARLLFHGEFPPRRPKHDPRSLGLDGLPEHIKLHVGAYRHSFAANHNKAILIDNHLILTGVNFQKENYGPNQFHDGALFIPNDAAEAAYYDFKFMWNKRSNANEEVGINPAHLNFMAQQSEHSCSTLYVTNTIRSWPATLPFYQAALPPDPLNNAYVAAIAHANSIIRITVPNLNTPEIIEGLAEFINHRLGRIELLMGREFNDFSERLYGGNNQYAVDTLYSKVEVNKQDHLDIRWFNRESTGDKIDVVHMKFMAIDDQVVIYGSSNLDVLSLHNSHEANVVIDSQEFTKKMTAKFFTPFFSQGVKASKQSSDHQLDF